jgi:cell division protein FtsB
MWWRAKSYAQRLIILVAVGVLLLVLFGFSRSIAEYSRLNAQLEREGAQLTELSATQDYLEDQIAFATSEAAVEQWAREEARWAQEGDFPVIPLAPPNLTPQAENAAQSTPSASGNWQTWMAWLFNSRP